MHPAMGPHYGVPREPEDEPLGPDQPSPRLGRGKRGTWLALAGIVSLTVVVLVLAVALV